MSLRSLVFAVLIAIGATGYGQTLEKAPEVPKTDTLGPGDRLPVPKNLQELRRRISYPKAALDAGIEGRVELRVLIDERGRYIKHKILKSSDDLLYQVCAAHIVNIRFKPGKQEGKRVKAWVTVPFDFVIDPPKNQ